MIDGNAKDNHLWGTGGDDIIHGHGGGDMIDGGAGDDELFGDEGDDTLSGGAGNDVILGDVGVVKRLYNADGTKKLKADGTWAKEVLLLDVANILSERKVNASTLIDANFPAQEMALLVGVQDSKGKWETRLLYLDLEPAGNDTIMGDDGKDLIFGQRGDDTLYGGLDDDYLEGNEGNDTLYGDRAPRGGGDGGGTLTRADNAGQEGDDILIGDNSFNFAANADELPVVSHGYELNPTPAVECGTLPTRGAMVVPMATLTPYGIQQVDPFGAGLYHGAKELSVLSGLTPLADSSGRVYTVFASIIPDAGRHLDLVAGNDSLYGDGGNDRLIGDYNAILAPFQTNVTNVLTDLEHAMLRLDWLEQMLPPHPVTIATVASDYLDGGSGDDMLIGDSNFMLVGSASTTANLPAGLEQAADDFDDAVEGYAKKVKGTPAPVGFVSGQDTLLGEDGNDVLIGDHNIAIGLVAEGPVGTSASAWLSKVKLPSLSVKGAQDTLSGGFGDDVLIGDARVDVLAGVGANPFASLPNGALVVTADEMATTGFGPGATGLDTHGGPFTPVLDAAPGTGSSGFHTVTLGRIIDSLTLTGAADILDGGEDNDTLIGDNSLLVSAYVKGPFVTLDGGMAHPDKKLVQVNDLIDGVTLKGATDRLAGSGGHDVLIGDHDVTVAGIFEGPVLAIGAVRRARAPRPSRATTSWCTSAGWSTASALTVPSTCWKAVRATTC